MVVVGCWMYGFEGVWLSSVVLSLVHGPTRLHFVLITKVGSF